MWLTCPSHCSSLNAIIRSSTYWVTWTLISIQESSSEDTLWPNQSSTLHVPPYISNFHFLVTVLAYSGYNFPHSIASGLHVDNQADRSRKWIRNVLSVWYLFLGRSGLDSGVAEGKLSSFFQPLPFLLYRLAFWTHLPVDTGF